MRQGRVFEYTMENDVIDVRQSQSRVRKKTWCVKVDVGYADGPPDNKHFSSIVETNGSIDLSTYGFCIP